MLDSDQITFPSFAPSLSQSPRQLKQSTKPNNNYQHPSHKLSIKISHTNFPYDDYEEDYPECQEEFYNQSDKQNKNQQQHLKDVKEDDATRVRIYCRLRPPQKVLYEYKYDTSMIDDGENCYSFDRIFGKFTSQQYIFNKIATRHIKDLMQGRNSTIFAYGQTGSGKTHTMFGNLKQQEEYGIIPRTLEEIFNSKNEGDMISCSMLQIYNEKMMDLFIFPQHNSGQAAELKLKQLHDQIFIEGLVQVQVENKSQILDLMRLGHKNRKVASTYNNDTSSRSHTILFVFRTYKQKGLQFKCKLCFIDLAGSQKVRKSGVKGINLQEAKKINLSLSCLGNVVHALTTNSQHIPYRNSKLTRILKDSLSGQTNTSIITTCSTQKVDYQETISTIKFATRAKKIKNKKKMENVQIPVQELMKKLMKELDETKKELNWYKMKQELQKYNAVDIPQEDTCLMPESQLPVEYINPRSNPIAFQNFPKTDQFVKHKVPSQRDYNEIL